MANESRLSAKKLGLGLFLLYLGEISGKLLALLTFGHLARVLGTSRYGDLEFAIAILFVGNLVLDAGLAPYGAREAARAPGGTKTLAARICRIRLMLFGIWTLGLVLLAPLSPGDDLARLLLLLTPLVLLPLPFLLNWAFEARGEMGVVAGSSFLRQALLALTVILVVDQPREVFWVPLLDAGAFLAAVLVQQVLLRRRIGSLQLWQPPGEVGRVLRESLPLAISSLVWALRLFAPLLALYLVVGEVETARFGAAHRLVIALHTLIWLYFVNLLPELSRRAADTADFMALIRSSLKLITVAMLVLLPVGIFLSGFAVKIIYGADFAFSAEPLAILGGLLALAFISGHVRYGLIARGHLHWELEASVLGVLVALLGLFYCGRDLDAIAAAWLLVAAEFATGLWAWHRFRRAILD